MMKMSTLLHANCSKCNESVNIITYELYKMQVIIIQYRDKWFDITHIKQAG